MHSLNTALYTDLPINELEDRLALEELEDRLEMGGCFIYWTD